jgi:hypothetical protein
MRGENGSGGHWSSLRNAVALAIADPERARIELGIPPASEICEEHQVE